MQYLNKRTKHIVYDLPLTHIEALTVCHAVLKYAVKNVKVINKDKAEVMDFSYDTPANVYMKAKFNLQTMTLSGSEVAMIDMPFELTQAVTFNAISDALTDAKKHQYGLFLNKVLENDVKEIGLTAFDNTLLVPATKDGKFVWSDVNKEYAESLTRLLASAIVEKLGCNDYESLSLDNYESIHMLTFKHSNKKDSYLDLTTHWTKAIESYWTKEMAVKLTEQAHSETSFGPQLYNLKTIIKETYNTSFEQHLNMWVKQELENSNNTKRISITKTEARVLN